jgi:hypothetical protein
VFPGKSIVIVYLICLSIFLYHISWRLGQDSNLRCPSKVLTLQFYCSTILGGKQEARTLSKNAPAIFEIASTTRLIYFPFVALFSMPIAFRFNNNIIFFNPSLYSS